MGTYFAYNTPWIRLPAERAPKILIQSQFCFTLVITFVMKYRCKHECLEMGNRRDWNWRLKEFWGTRVIRIVSKLYFRFSVARTQRYFVTLMLLFLLISFCDNSFKCLVCSCCYFSFSNFLEFSFYIVHTCRYWQLFDALLNVS